ncbi:MAG: hydrogenase maturation nickel metallochaperone HypA [Deinococcota bacterium]
MHELSIAQSIVEVAEREASERGAHVDAIYVQLGALSGVVKDALLFSYDIATQGTGLEHSQLIIEDIPVSIYCATCQLEHELDGIQSLRCPICNQPSADIRRGKELDIRALELVDAAPT